MSKPSLEDSQFFKLFCHSASYPDLPRSWTTIQFDDIIEDVTDSKLKLLSSEIKETGEFAVVDQGQKLIAGYTSKKELLRHISLPVIVFGDHTRSFKYIDFPFVQGADGTRVLRVKIEKITKYLYYFFLHLNLPSKGYSRHYKYLKQVFIPICNETEASRIVLKIESAQEKIKSIEVSASKADKLIEKYRESILEKAFRGGLVPQDPKDESASMMIARVQAENEKQSDAKNLKKKYQKPIKPDEIPFEIPRDWKWVRLDEVIEIMTDYVANGSFASLRENVKVKGYKDFSLYVRLTDLRVGLGHEGQKYVDKKSYEFLKKSDLSGGEILVANVGANFGESLIMPEVEQPATIAPNMIIVKVDARLSSNEYIQMYFSSLSGQRFFQSLVTLTAQPKFNKTDFKSMPIPLPPKQEQERIVKSVNKINAHIALQRTQLNFIEEKAQKLKSAVLSSAFEGKLVAQFSSEGSGHELIQSIVQSNRHVRKSALKRNSK